MKIFPKYLSLSVNTTILVKMVELSVIHHFCEIPPVPIYPPSSVKFCQCRGQAKQTLVHPMKIPILPGLHLLATCTVFPKTFQDCAYNELLNKYFKVNSNCRRTPVTSNQPRFVGSTQSINVGTRKMVNYAWPG